jgi:hypothetical protein
MENNRLKKSEVPHLKITIAILFLGINTLLAQEPADSIKQVNLEEVVVKADRVVSKGDHVLLYPSNENKTFGTNALDAISSMDLFWTSINETSLFSWDRQKVTILINGVPSTPYDLRTYKGTDVKHVEYYAVAPPRYMDLTEGPVVNVLVKKRHDRSLSGYANTSNAVNTGFGTNQVDLTYTDSLNQFKLDYLIDYRDIHRSRHITDFTYSDDTYSHYDGDLKYSGAYQEISASYQRYQAKHLFNAKVYSIIDPGTDSESRLGTLKSEGVDYKGEGKEELKSHSYSACIDLYYRYMLNKGRLFAVNVINTLGKDDSYSFMALQGVNASNVHDYNVSSRFNNHSYAFTVNSYYSSKLWGGKVNAGLRYDYKRLRQESNGMEYDPNTQNRYFLNVGGNWGWNSIHLVPAIGLQILSQRSYASSHHSVSPYFRLYTDWWGNGKAQGATVQFTLTMRNTPAALSNLTEGISYVDPWLISTGNPNLKSAWKTSGNLVLGYFNPNNKNTINLQITPSYAYHQTGTILVKKEGVMTLQPQNLSDLWKCDFSLNVSCKPVKWLELATYVEYYTAFFDTPSQKIHFRYPRIGGLVMGRFNQTTVVLAANSATKEYDGDILSRGSAQFSAKIQYKLGDWSLGASCNYLGHHEYDSAHVPELDYYNEKDLKRLHYLTRLMATYSFSVGHSRRHANRILNSQNLVDGLTKYSKPRATK